MTLAILVLIFALLVTTLDWVHFRKDYRRVLYLEILGFVFILTLALYPERFNDFAHRLGIGRGVDMIIYPLLVWLFREALWSRVRYMRQQRELTLLVRKTAMNHCARIDSPQNPS